MFRPLDCISPPPIPYKLSLKKYLKATYLKIGQQIWFTNLFPFTKYAGRFHGQLFYIISWMEGREVVF